MATQEPIAVIDLTDKENEVRPVVKRDREEEETLDLGPRNKKARSADPAVPRINFVNTPNPEHTWTMFVMTCDQMTDAMYFDPASVDEPEVVIDAVCRFDDSDSKNPGSMIHAACFDEDVSAFKWLQEQGIHGDWFFPGQDDEPIALKMSTDFHVLELVV